MCILVSLDNTRQCAHLPQILDSCIDLRSNSRSPYVVLLWVRKILIRMKQSVPGSIITHMETLGALIKDILCDWVGYRFFSLYCEKEYFDGTWLEKAAHVKYFRQFSTDFNKQGLRCTLITLGSYLKKKTFFSSPIFLVTLFFSAKKCVRS